MKTKKVVVGAIVASMLSIAALPNYAVAAGETVQISAGTDSAKAGETFSVEVSLADVPSTGIQGIDFAIEYDSSLITITSVEEGALVKSAAASDPTSEVALFATSKGDNYVNVTWSNSFTDPTYWIKSDGVFCVINGTVNAGAAAGKADIKLGAIKRETRPESGQSNPGVGIGYSKDGNAYSYDVNVTNGYVEITDDTVTTTTTTPVETSVTTTSAGQTETSATTTQAAQSETTQAATSGTVSGDLRGDANCDGNVNMADAVFIMQCNANPGQFKLTEKGKINGDVVGNGDGVTNNDALQIQKYEAGLVTEL